MTCGRGLRSIGVLFSLLVVLSLPLFSDEDPAEMTTAEIVDELTSIIETQETRLNEAEQLLTEQRTMLSILRRKLTGLSESYTQLSRAMTEQRNYSKNLETELQKVRLHRTVLLTISAISIAAAVVGWLL